MSDGDQHAVVSGATSGIGLATAIGLGQAGWRVTLLGRHPQRLADAATGVREAGGTTAVVRADLSDLDQVRDAAAQILEQDSAIDVLINNAALIPRRREESPQGNERQLAVNHLAPFVLTSELRDRLIESAPARVVTVASDAHRFGRLDLDDLQRSERRYGWLGLARYCETKIMNILFTRELASRLHGSGVTANAVHPGGVATGLGSPPRWMGKLTRRWLKTPEDGARTSLYCATDPSLRTATGGYYADERPATRPPTEAATDPSNQQRLWDLSAALTNR